MKIILHDKEDLQDLKRLSRYLHDFVVWEFKPWFRFQKQFPYVWCGLTQPVSLDLDVPILNTLVHLYTEEMEKHDPEFFVIDETTEKCYRHEDAVKYWWRQRMDYMNEFSNKEIR